MMWYTAPPQKKWTNIDTQKRDEKGPFLKRKWIIFQLVWFSEASCYFSGGVFEVYLFCFWFSHRLYEINMRQFLIHQFTVFFLGGIVWYMMQLLTAQPDWDVWEWWVWTKWVQFCLECVSKIIQKRLKWCFKVWKKRGVASFVATFIEVCGATSRRHKFCIHTFFRRECFGHTLKVKMFGKMTFLSDGSESYW